MNKRFLTLAAALLVVGGFSSCNKVVEVDDTATFEGGTGDLKLSVALPGLTTKAVSDEYNVPTTQASDIDNVYLFITDEDGNTVSNVDVTSSVLEAMEQSSNTNTFTVTGIRAGTDYTVFLVANYKANDENTTQAVTYGYGGLPGGDGWNPPNGYVLGIEEVTPSNYDVYLEDVTTARGVAPNYFVGSKDGLTIQKNQILDAGTIYLKRIENLFRARLKVEDSENGGYASQNSPAAGYLDFTDASTVLILRQVQSKYNVTDGTYSNDGSDNTVSVCVGAFSGSEPTTSDGYTGSSKYTARDTENGYNLYKDMLFFPPRAQVTGDDEDDGWNLNVLLIAKTQEDGYVPYGYEDPVVAGTTVYWTQNIAIEDIANVGNKVVIANLQLTSSGRYTDEQNPVTPPTSSGNLRIDVQLEDWTEVVEKEVVL